MGMNLGGMIFLQDRGFLSPTKHRLLDIGPQNVYRTTPEQIDAFVRRQGPIVSEETLQAEKARLTYFSTPRPDERTTLFSEIADLTNIEYNSFDVCPGLKTELLDLNFETLPEEYREYYDVVLNFGTTEHIFNQWNSFEIMHDALKVGGVFYHQLPASGYLDHGYYCYTPLFFHDLAKANGYIVEDLFTTRAEDNSVEDVGLDVRGLGEKLGVKGSAGLSRADQRIPFFDIHVILRKTRSAPFRVSLEIATAHAAAYEGVARRYGASEDTDVNGTAVEPRISELVADRERKIAELVEDRERKLGDLVLEREALIGRVVAERETIISQLVAERDAAYARLSAIEQTLVRRVARGLRRLVG